MKNGWEIKRLPEVAEYFIGLTYSPKDVSNKGTIVLRSSNIQNDELDLSNLVRVARPVKEGLIVRKGDILMCSRNGSKRLVGKTALISNLPEEMTFGTFMTVIRGKPNPYLAWFFKSDAFREQIGVGENTMINQITKYMLDAIRVPFPPPDEQQRIVGILNEAFEGIATAKANAEKNLQNTRAIFESHLHSVFTQRGEGWVEKKLGDVAVSISTGPFGTMLHKSDYVPDGIPLVNPMNIVDSRIVPSNKMMVNEKTRDRLRGYALRVGDVVIGRRGELGRCALVTEREEGWLCGTGSFFVRLSDDMDGRFFVAMFGSQQFKARLEGNAVGTTMSSLNHGILNELRLPVPPIAVQKKEMAKAEELLSETRRLESIYQRKIATLETLKKSLLHQAFTGQL